MQAHDALAASCFSFLSSPFCLGVYTLLVNQGVGYFTTIFFTAPDQGAVLHCSLVGELYCTAPRPGSCTVLLHTGSPALALSTMRSYCTTLENPMHISRLEHFPKGSAGNPCSQPNKFPPMQAVSTEICLSSNHSQIIPFVKRQV